MRRGPIDAIMLLFGKTPFRCRACQHRFYSSENQAEEIEEDEEGGEQATDSAG